MSKRKHYRQPPIRSLMQRSLPPPPRDDLPRRVVVDFDRWIDAQRAGNWEAARRLAANLKRAGYEPRSTPGVSGTPMFWLREL